MIENPNAKYNFNVDCYNVGYDDYMNFEKYLVFHLQYDLLVDCENMTYTVKPGEVIYQGTFDDIVFNISIFVPTEDSCEIWSVNLSHVKGEKKFLLTVGEDLAFMNTQRQLKTEEERDDITI